MPLGLFALTVSAFAIGTTEFVIVGLIPEMAADLDVSIPTAGLLVSLYAFAIAIGAPIVTALTGGLPRRALAIGLMIVFTVGNLMAAFAPGYGMLLAGRIVTGVAHGAFFSIGTTVAMSLVDSPVLRDSYAGLILPAVASGFVCFFLRQYIRGIPRALDEAAFIDGASAWTVLWHVIVPLSKPALFSMGLFLFLSEWNSYI